MSKNAQFRAIQPSPAILSFVEDNVIIKKHNLLVYLFFVAVFCTPVKCFVFLSAIGSQAID